MATGVPLIAIPNVSEGRDAGVIAALVAAVGRGGALVLDVHSDQVHNRSVITAAGDPEPLIGSMAHLAEACADLIDLRLHVGVHPRLGALDVCPFVPWEATIDLAVEVAEEAAATISDRTGIPTILYGRAAGGSLELPEIRRRGLANLPGATQVPHAGSWSELDQRSGVVCVGARGPLVAFNVWLRSSPETARAIARAVRSSSGGPPGIRALGLDLGDGMSQVSMNLTEPDVTGVDAAFQAVVDEAAGWNIEPARTELVGLAFARHLPTPDARAARLMEPPGRSFESALEALRS